MAAPQLQIEQRLDRIEEAILVLATSNVQAQGSGLADRDLARIKEILGVEDEPKNDVGST